MAASEPPFRPILGGGERLSESVIVPRGGRKPWQPQTFGQARGRLAPMVREVREQAEQLPDALRARRLVIEATILPNFLANSHYPATLFGAVDLVPLGTRGARRPYVTRFRDPEDAPTKTFLLSASDSSLIELSNILETDRPGLLSERLVEDVVKFDELHLPRFADVFRPGTGEVIEIADRVALEAVLQAPISSEATEDDEFTEVFAKWISLIGRFGGDVREDYLRREDQLAFVPVLLPPAAIRDVAAFNPLRTLRPMPRVVPLPHPFRAVSAAIVRPPAERPETDLRVAVFDGGIDATAPALRPFVTATDLTEGAVPDPAAVAHGTTVTSALLYGSLDDDVPREPPPAWVDMFRVWPPPAAERADVHLYWVLRQIERQLASGSHRYVSLSLGPQFNVEVDKEPHAWTLALDRIGATDGILFFVAAGNTGADDPDAGHNRIGVPADLANGLSIGACDVPSPRPWRRAIYSSVGPGRPGATVAPVVLGHGGELDGEHPFGCVAPGGLRAHSDGTSLATPCVARAVLRLAGELDEPPSLNALRAFAVHFAERDFSKPTAEVGYGRVPADLTGFLSSDPEEVTLLYAGTLPREGSVTVRLPLPDDVLANVANRLVRLRWTLTFTSPTDGADAVDYARSGIEVLFRPDGDVFWLRKDDAEISVNRRDDPELFDRYITTGWVASDRPRTRAKKGYAPEIERRQRDGKWETTIRVDDQMKARSLMRPAFDMSFVSREGGALTDPRAPQALPYALLATLTAPPGVPLYDRVRAVYPVLAPLTTSVPIRITT